MIEAVAWTLIHFAWQGTLVWLLVSLLLRFTRAVSTRYFVACAAMLVMLLLPALTLVSLTSHSRLPVPRIEGTMAPVPVSASDTSPVIAPTQWPGFLVLLWAAGVFLLSIRNAGGLLLAYVRRYRAVLALPEEAQEVVRRLAVQLGLRTSVRLRGSADSVTPAVFGCVNPVIVIPAAVLGLPGEQLEAILAHELAHIRRHDFLVNILQNFVETLLFYHPAVWSVGRQIREEREHCCDDLAVSISNDRVTYARALTNLAALRNDLAHVAVAATGGPLYRRVARLLGQIPPAVPFSSFGPITLAALITVGALSGTALTKQQNGASEAGVAVAGAATKSSPAAYERVTTSEQPTAKHTQSSATQTVTRPTSGLQSYVDQLASAGYADLSVDDLVALKIQDIAADYIRSFQSVGLKPTVEELVAMHIHDVTAEYAQALRTAGFSNMTVDQMVAGKIHGVDPVSVGQFKALGVTDLSFDDVVAAQIHGVTPDFVRNLQAAGFSALTFDQVIAAAIHGIDPKAVHDLQDAGAGPLTFDQVLSAQIHGVTADFIRRAQQLGLKDLTFEKVIQRKILGILN